MMRRQNIAIAFFLVISVVISVFSLSVQPQGIISSQNIPKKRSDQDKYCFDFTKILPQNLVREINTQGEALRRVFDIDFVVIIVPSLGEESIVEYTADLFSEWEVGRNTKGAKGVLIFIAQREQQIRIEVGYDLEHIYTDLYVAQVEREMLKEFLEQADWERGFLATVENFVERTYRMYKKGLDVREVVSGADDYYSGGAGAKTTFDFGVALKKPLPVTPKGLREYFSAQSNPELAFLRYMEFCARNMSDYTLDIFSEESKEFFSHWPTSSGQRRSEAEASNGKVYVVKQKGKYAVLMASPNAPINDFIMQCPYFFVRSKKGWQIDINTMSRSIIMGGPTWHFLSKLHPYMFAFKNYLIKMNRYYPLQGQKAFLGLTYSLWGERSEGFKITPEWDSPAKQSGIQDGDILISIDGIEIKEPYQDWEMMKNYSPGDVIDVVVRRGLFRKKIKVRLDEAKSQLDEFPYKKEDGDPWLGIYIGYSEPYERDIIETYDCILDVIENSPAEKASLKAGDCVVYDKNRDRLFSQDIKPGDKLTFKILRDLKDIINVKLETGSYSVGKEGL